MRRPSPALHTEPPKQSELARLLEDRPLGRKQKPPEEKRDNRVAVYLSDEELKKLKEQSKGLPLAIYARHCLLNHAVS